MDSKDKKALSETDICDLFITPAIKGAYRGQGQPVITQ
jgi:type I restriction enzyme R subunit